MANGLGQRRTPYRPPRLRGFSAMPKGPRAFQKLRDPLNLSGPGEPPPGFLMPTNSRTEWFAYWGLHHAMSTKGDPADGPFIGEPGVWEYQTPYDGGRVIGGQVIDFVVLGIGTAIGGVAIRITTQRYHIETDEAKQATDTILRAKLGRNFRVTDVYENDIINDPSGQAAVIQMKLAAFGGQTRNPLSA